MVIDMEMTIQKINPRKVKRLSLDNWQMDIEYDLKDYKEIVKIPPVFNKNGQYFCKDSGFYWFEKDGNAYHYPNQGKQFVFELEHLRHRRLRFCEIKAIEVLITNKICPKELLTKYDREMHLKHLRQIRVETFCVVRI